MARLYADENFPRPVVDALRRIGHDAITASEDGRAGLSLPDEAVLERANELGRAVLTHNRRHFRRLHVSGTPHSGVIACKSDPDFDALAARIDEALAGEPDPAGKLIRVNRPWR